MPRYWHLMVTICFFAPGAGAAAWAKAWETGWRGEGLAWALGLVLGLGCAWALHTAGMTAGARVVGRSESLQKWSARALSVAATIWIFAAVLLGIWFASLTLHRF